MNVYSGDEFSSEDEFNSSDNSIVDQNDDVLKDGSDGKEGTLTKGPWRPKEDKWLISLVKKNGEGNWRIIAMELKRTPKSCRLRWFNQLNPKINRKPFTPVEDKIIVNMIKKGDGNGKWSQIANILEGRTDNQVKNRWNSKLRKQSGHLRKRNPNRKFSQTAKAACGKVKCRHSSVSPPRLAGASISPYFPHDFVVSDPFAGQIYLKDSLCPAHAPAPAFNRFTSLSLCPPGHETDDILNPSLARNPSGFYPSPSQQYAPFGTSSTMMQDAMAIEPEQPSVASDLDGLSLLE